MAEMFVDGAWTSSLSGETFTADSLEHFTELQTVVLS
jgi:hypothetical protein